MSALREPRAEESSVQSNQDPRAALEEDSSEQQADPEEDLEGGNDGHAGVVVLLDEDADLLSQSTVSLGLASGTIGGRGRGADGGQKVGAGVGGDVEDGVDAVGEQGEGVLGREQPDKGENWQELAIGFLRQLNVTYAGTGRSHQRVGRGRWVGAWSRSWHGRAGSCRRRFRR